MNININKNFFYNMKTLLIKLRFSFILSGTKRSKWLKKKKIFAAIGDNVFWQPRFIPTDPYYLILHNNIAIAANVTFYMHDIINHLYNNMQNTKIYGYASPIEIMDNVFIGGGSIICPNVRIGPNAIVAAGSVVTKDVKPGTIVGGNPARVIGNFNDLMQKRIIMNEYWHMGGGEKIYLKMKK